MSYWSCEGALWRPSTMAATRRSPHVGREPQRLPPLRPLYVCSEPHQGIRTFRAATDCVVWSPTWGVSHADSPGRCSASIRDHVVAPGRALEGDGRRLVDRRREPHHCARTVRALDSALVTPPAKMHEVVLAPPAYPFSSSGSRARCAAQVRDLFVSKDECCSRARVDEKISSHDFRRPHVDCGLTSFETTSARDVRARR